MDRDREAQSDGDHRHIRRVGRLAWAARTLLALALASLAARFLVADRWIATEWNFHIPLPLPVLAALGAVLLSRPPKRAAAVLAAGLPLLLLAVIWREQPNLLPRRAAPESPNPIRLVAWNLMSYNLGEEKITQTLAGDDADIICILEGTDQGKPPDFLRKALGKNIHWASTRQMAIGSRIPIRDSGELPTQSRLRVFRATLEVQGRECAVYLIDMPTPPRLDTRDMYNELWAILKLEERPFLLVGDFNTPRGSWHLRRATRDLVDVYPAAGRWGWLASWPSVFPIYQLDHAFCSGEFRPVDAHFGDARASDHCRQIVDFEWTNR